MILVDTSVMVDYLRGRDSAKTALFAEILFRDIPFGISAYTYQELLLGARDEKEFEKLEDYLSSQKIYFLPADMDTHRKAAKIYFDLRRSGITVRGSIDVLIALTAIENKLALLHDDRDFDNMAAALDSLIILEHI